MSRYRSHLITNARGNSKKTLHKIMKSKKVAVLTRAANDIGRALAIEFARDGYTIMINDISERQLQQTVEDILSSLSETKSTKKNMKNNNIVDYNNCISYFTGDTSKEEVSVSLIEGTIKRFRRIDVLINNATISQQSIASQSYEMGTASTNSSASINYGEQSRSSPYFRRVRNCRYKHQGHLFLYKRTR
jgi:NAD(P)-dependent dehydrogenase (short-subunit alcohol dehydrogenase family)